MTDHFDHLPIQTVCRSRSDAARFYAEDWDRAMRQVFYVASVGLLGLSLITLAYAVFRFHVLLVLLVPK